MLLKVEGFRGIERAMALLGIGEHLWIRGIGDVLIYVSVFQETTYRMSVFSVEKIGNHFSLKMREVDGVVHKDVALHIIKKICARPCKVVKNNLVNEPQTVDVPSKVETTYQDYIYNVEKLGLKVQVSL